MISTRYIWCHRIRTFALPLWKALGIRVLPFAFCRAATLVVYPVDIATQDFAPGLVPAFIYCLTAYQLHHMVDYRRL